MKNLFFIAAVFSLIFYGCSSNKDMYLDSRDIAFMESWRGYNQLNKVYVNHVIEIENLRVYFTSDDLGKTKDGRKIIGLATSNGVIIINATILEGKIVTNEMVLGHELLHILNRKDSFVADPHEPPLRENR